MRKYWRFGLWLLVMLVLGAISLDAASNVGVLTEAQFGPMHIGGEFAEFLLMMMPIIATVMSMWIWGIIGFNFTFNTQQDDQPLWRNTKRKNASDPLTRLVDDLDDDQIIELETLLASRYEDLT